jgi:hypothetical protein
VPAVPRLCQLYPGICLTAEEKHGKPSVRVAKKCPDIPVAVVQYTFRHKQNTERNKHNNAYSNGLQLLVLASDVLCVAGGRCQGVVYSMLVCFTNN